MKITQDYHSNRMQLRNKSESQMSEKINESYTTTKSGLWSENYLTLTLRYLGKRNWVCMIKQGTTGLWQTENQSLEMHQ